VTNTNIEPIRPFDDDTALAWLKAQGPVDLPQKALAQRWGWSKQRTSKRLMAWERAGLIRRDGVALVAATEGTISELPVRSPVRSPERLPQIQSQKKSKILGTAINYSSPSPISRPAKFKVDFVAVLLGVTALALAGIGMTVNARYAGSLGATADGSLLLAGVGLTADMLALILPSAASRLWANRQWIGSFTAWVIWVGVLALTLLATSGWSATNLGDAIAGRVASVDRADGLRERLGQLREARKAETELRRRSPSCRPFWRPSVGCLGALWTGLTGVMTSAGATLILAGGWSLPVKHWPAPSIATSWTGR
jgi:MarR family